MIRISLQLAENWIKGTDEKEIEKYIDSMLETLPYVKDASKSSDELLEKIGNIMIQWQKIK